MASAARRSSADTAAANRRSGRLLLRMPAPLHDELSRSAEREGVSLNQLIVRTLEASVGVDAPHIEAAPEPRRSSRLLGVALVANLIVVALAGAVAVGLLLLAWNS